MKEKFFIGGIVCFIIAIVLFVVSIILKVNNVDTDAHTTLSICGWGLMGLGWISNAIGFSQKGK